jgi:hypothetical protein
MPRGRRDIDDHLIAALTCGATLEVAAQKVQVSLATVRRRMQDPKFKKRLDRVASSSGARSGRS